MRLRPFILILPFLCWAFDVKAQVPQELSSMPEQWQLTLDVIKSKAQTLVIENNGLQVEYRQLMAQVQKLRQSVYEQQASNDQMDRFLKDRHGRTDQQVRIDELTQGIKIKNQEARTFDEQVGNLQRKQSDLAHKIQLLKYTISDVELHQQAQKQQAQISQETVQTPVDDQLTQWRQQLEDENKQEVLLENELGALKTGDKTQNLNVDAIDEENKQLEARLNLLQLQKLQHDKKSSDVQLADASRRMYYKIKGRKDLLEANITAYETRMDQLREYSLMALSWPLKKKKMIHEMVQTDARNNQMRDKIKVLQEDIGLLRDQVAKLERRVDFAQGQDQDATFKSAP
jgi:chromosome segregation ATPase